MSPSALVIGEALIDEVVEGDRVSRHPGGSPANVALGLARLGVVTYLHTAIGDDADGELIHRQLSASGVTVTAGSVTNALTSKAVVILAQDGSASYRFTLSWDPAHLDDLGSPTIIHTGSLGAFLQPGSEVTRDIIRRGRSLGALISFDPNIRPTLLPEPGRTRGSFEELAFSTQLTKLSDEDAEYLYPGTPLDDVLDLLIDGGVSVAAITRGGEDAYLASGGNVVRIPSVRTRVADTVGAGDSFMAALIWALAFDKDGWDGGSISADRLQAIGDIAARAAAITVSRAGADLPYPSDIQATNLPRHEGENL
ncbi:carbohydrate kinase family protein [Lacisediminihabitans profunda]|uniref:Carbohydrate kinase n=1 Tax=Lacisediminihabitans profunda TaxID=2594790 RepID=A0A5C8UL74_9MICO|nr:carbohydrate kinase [Lacisediminihabitans profunda]TXN28893.1 carbohydrate kinase [Lacisediminihabitans profunda]